MKLKRTQRGTYVGKTVKWWARAFFLGKAIALSPLLLWEFGAIRGRRPVRWEAGAVSWVNAINAASGGWLQSLFARLTFRPLVGQCSEGNTVEPIINNDRDAFGIHDDGFQFLDSLISQEYCEQIVVTASSAPVKDDYGVVFEDLSTWLKSEKASDRAFLQIDEDWFLRSFVLDNKTVLCTVKSFLRAEPLVVSVQAWATRPPVSVRALNNDVSGMMFHCDADYLNFVKLFIPLTDASLTGGSTEFVRFSHKNRRHVLGRISDEEARDSATVLRADCAVGSGYLCATTGWHRGGIPDRGVRVVAQVLFSADLLGRKPPQNFPVRCDQEKRCSVI